MDQLNFSEEACIQRYVTFTHFDENGKDYLHIEGIEHDDPIISCLQRYGSIAVDWDTHGTKRSAVAEEALRYFGMAA